MTSTPFVGRTAELGLLEDRLRRACTGEGSVVFISADPGAGKSTLIGRFLERTAQDHTDVRIIRATCSEQYGAGEPYQPFVEAFRDLTRESDGPRRSLREIARQIAPYWVAAIPVAGEVIAASLATAQDLRQTFSTGSRRTAAPSEEALFFQYTELFFAASADAPIVLFLDDLHWADRATVSLLTHLGRRLGERRILIIGSYRPTELDAGHHPMRDARQELQRYRVATELPLEPLGIDALADLVLLHTGARPSRQLLDWLDRRAGSNALFFEELLGWLRDQGLAVENRGELELVRVPHEIEIPRSVESTIEKRLDRLDDATRRVLEYASVQGTEFESVTLSRLLEMDELELEELLDPIARVHRLIRHTGTLDLPNGDIASEYEFSHSLIHDVVHAGLQGKRRILLHRKAAQVLESLYASDPAAVAPRLALHFEEGRQPDKAFDYAILAAAGASRVYARWQALDQLERALRNASDAQREALAYERLGDEYLAIARYREAIDAFTSALHRLAEGDASNRDLVLRHKRLVGERNQGARPIDELLAGFSDLRTEARRVGALAEECRIIWHMIDLPGSTESMDLTLARDALSLAEQSGDPWLRARGREMLGIALTFGGDPQTAVTELQDAARQFAEVGDRSREAGCRNNLALARVFLGELANAAHEFSATAELFDEIVDPGRAAAVRTNMGALFRMVGDYDRAQQVLLESIRIAERLDAPVRMLSPLQNLAEVHEARGEWNEAEIRWSQLLQRARDTGYRAEQVTAHCGLGTVRLRLGDLQAATAAERAARAIVGDDTPSLGDSGEALRLFSARLAAATGEADGATALLDGLLASLEGNDPYLSAVCILEKAAIIAATDPRAAHILAQQAHTEFARLGAQPQVDNAEALIQHIRNEQWPSPEPAVE